MADVILDNVTINKPVADLTALAAIPTGALQNGVQVFVISVGIMYEWSGSAWTFTGSFPPVANGMDLASIVTTGFVANKVTTLQVDTQTEYLWNGSAWVAALAGGGANPDGTYLVQASANAPVNAQVMASLGTGLVKNTTTTGVQSIGVDGTDYYGPATTTIDEDVSTFSLFMGAGTGSASAADFNTGFGYTAGKGITTGTNNTFFGSSTGKNVTTGQYNTAFGEGSLATITTTTRNTALGQEVMSGSTTADSCIGIGPSAMATVNGHNNIGIGIQSLFVTVGNYNVAVGDITFRAMTAGSNNVAVGYQAGTGYVAYDSCTLVGSSADVQNSLLTNAGAFGYQATIGIGNAINLGNNCFVGINNPFPLGTLDIPNVGSTCDIIMDITTAVPPNLPGRGIIYVNNDDLYFNSPSGVVTPVTRTNLVVSHIGISYTDINSTFVIFSNLDNVNTTVTRILIYQTTPVLGGDLVVQYEFTVDPIMNFTAVQLAANTVVTESIGAPGANYFVTQSNKDMVLGAVGTLTAGVVNIQVEYYLT